MTKKLGGRILRPRPQGAPGPPGPAGPQGPQGPPGPSAIIVGGGTRNTNLINTDGTVRFVPMFDSEYNPTETEVQQAVPISGTLRNFHVRLSTASVNRTYTSTVRKNGAATTVTCAISPGQIACSDVTNSDAFTAGDLIAIEVVTTGSGSGPGTRTMRWTARFEP